MARRFRRARSAARRVYRVAKRRAGSGMNDALQTVIGAAIYKYGVQNISSRLPINPVLSESGMALVAPMVIKNRYVKSAAKATLTVNTLRVLNGGLGVVTASSTSSSGVTYY